MDLSLCDQVMLYLEKHDATGVIVANHFQISSVTYGRQRATSSAIARLRKDGYLEDCPRCEHCHRALSRHHRNVPLILTEAGRARCAMLRQQYAAC